MTPGGAQFSHILDYANRLLTCSPASSRLLLRWSPETQKRTVMHSALAVSVCSSNLPMVLLG